MLASPLLLVTLVSTLLLGGLAQPDPPSGCPPRTELSPEDAAAAEAVVRNLVAAVSTAAAPGADPSAVTAAEAEIRDLMRSLPPDPSFSVLDFLWLPHPTDPSTPLTVGEPLELYLQQQMGALDQINVTVEVSNGTVTRTVQFWLLNEEGEWRVRVAYPVALDPAGCYLPAPPEGEGGNVPPLVISGPAMVAGSPVAVGEGEPPPDAPPVDDPSEQIPPDIGLHVVNADGSDLTRLVLGFFGSAWSPDGTRIAFSRFGPEAPPDIAVINADGTGETALASTPRWDMSPAWSPDGTRLAFLSQIDVHVALYVVNADGSGLTELAVAEQAYLSELDSPPAWSPDGNKIAFIGPGEAGDAGSRSSSVWVVDADGSDLTQLTDLPGAVSGPVWSPDGTRLAFAHEVYEDVGPRSNALYVMNADGTDLTALTGWEPPEGFEPVTEQPAASPEPESTAIQSAPAWSPDGTRLAFTTIDGLAVIGADGANLAVHAVDEIQVWDPVWSPDGTQIAFSGAGFDAYPDIYVVHPDGSGLRRVAGTEWADVAIAWSPDGSQLAFTAIPPFGN